MVVSEVTDRATQVRVYAVVLLQYGGHQLLVVPLDVGQGDGQCIALRADQFLSLSQILQYPINLEPRKTK